MSKDWDAMTLQEKLRADADGFDKEEWCEYQVHHATPALWRQAADRIDELEARIAKLESR